MSEEGLYSLAEIAITLAGFTGLLALYRSSISATEAQLKRIFYIFLFCFATVVGAFLPGTIMTFLPDSNLNWQVSTGFVGSVLLVTSIWAIFQFTTSRIRLSLPIWSYLMAVISGFVGTTLLAATFGIILGPLKGFLIIGLLCCLLYSGYIFVSTLFWGTGDDSVI